MTDWCILRTASSRTLLLAEALAKDGYEVWTPVDTVRRSRPRSKAVREVIVPILPAFVFARYDQLSALLALSRSPGMIHQVWDTDLRRMVSRGCPYFSPLLDNGRSPSVSDASLAPLRALERQLRERAERACEAARRKGPAPQFAAGEIVRIPDGPYEGLDLQVVEANAGKTVKLAHPSWLWTIEISAFAVRDVQLKHPLPERGADKIGMVS